MTEIKHKSQEDYLIDLEKKYIDNLNNLFKSANSNFNYVVIITFILLTVYFTNSNISKINLLGLFLEIDKNNMILWSPVLVYSFCIIMCIDIVTIIKIQTKILINSSKILKINVNAEPIKDINIFRSGVVGAMFLIAESLRDIILGLTISKIFQEDKDVQNFFKSVSKGNVIFPMIIMLTYMIPISLISTLPVSIFRNVVLTNHNFYSACFIYLTMYSIIFMLVAKISFKFSDYKINEILINSKKVLLFFEKELLELDLTELTLKFRIMGLKSRKNYYEGFKNEMQEMGKNLEGFESEMQEIGKSLEGFKNDIQEIGKSFEEFENEIQETEKSLEDTFKKNDSAKLLYEKAKNIIKTLELQILNKSQY